MTLWYHALIAILHTAFIAIHHRADNTLYESTTVTTAPIGLAAIENLHRADTALGAIRQICIAVALHTELNEWFARRTIKNEFIVVGIPM